MQLVKTNDDALDAFIARNEESLHVVIPLHLCQDKSESETVYLIHTQLASAYDESEDNENDDDNNDSKGKDLESKHT